MNKKGFLTFSFLAVSSLILPPTYAMEPEADEELCVHFLLKQPKDLTYQILFQLSPRELARLGQTCSAFLKLSEEDSLWQPLYHARKRQLLPFLKESQDIGRDLGISFISHKFALGIMTLLQRSFTSDPPDKSLLVNMIHKAISKSGYKDLILARLYAFQGKQEDYEAQAEKLLHYCPDQFLTAIYWGTWPFAQHPKQERLQLLDIACEHNAPNALRHKEPLAKCIRE